MRPIRSLLGSVSRLALGSILVSVGAMGQAETRQIGGSWNVLKLSGDLAAIDPGLRKFRWQIENQSRLRDDDGGAWRFSQNLLYSQLGYSITDRVCVWLGYVHAWNHRLDGDAFQENRPYQEVLAGFPGSGWQLASRTRLEQRIRQDNGVVAVRLRQHIALKFPLPSVAPNLAAYLGDEVFFYLNQSSFGPIGFSQNRISTGVIYDISDELAIDVGYLGQYLLPNSGDQVFTHNIRIELEYRF